MTTMRMHTRWHSMRGRVDDRCSVCRGEGATLPGDAPDLDDAHAGRSWSSDVDAWIRAERRVISPQSDGLGSQTTVLTHLDHARERRTPDERAALLDAALADLRAGTRRRVPSGGPLPF